MKTPRNYAEDHVQCHTLTRRAYLAEKTGAPLKMHERIRLRAHLSACQKKIGSNGRQVGSADPRGQPNLDKHWSRYISRRSHGQGT